ncbi:unnamed protein product [Oppiella nova]|uniref:Uncharacterized protein n=1 Tax=Oppiella nova TaxID=334625 RepID=A0A7R9QLN7_9ACAR|nr:unnamed protein product [Oppiella nova]CAG2168090.1 unnamed protein product [Oppiella nova]
MEKGNGFAKMYCAECKNSADGVKAIATFKQCISAYPMGQAVNKKGDELKAKGTEACVTEFSKYLDTIDKHDKEQAKLKDCSDALFKSSADIKKC